jgi:hypothetical protein
LINKPAAFVAGLFSLIKVHKFLVKIFKHEDTKRIVSELQRSYKNNLCVLCV